MKELIAIITLVIGYYYFTRIFFLRDPKRIIAKGRTIISPADGKIVAITKIDQNIEDLKISKGLIGKIKTMTEFLGKKDGTMISIMLNVHNIHVQRVPTDGIVTEIEHIPGKLINVIKNAKKMEWLVNEKIETTIKNEEIGKIKVIQIAGFLARRCVSSLRINQTVSKGQKLGLIKLGSQVSIVLPATVKLKVKLNQKVTDGETVIAEY